LGAGSRTARPCGATGATGSVGSVTAISGTSNANGATISGGNLTLTPADANNAGVVTTGAQTFAGSKTFSSAIKITAGAPGAGKVLTSDATGLASWTTPAASANTVTMRYLIISDGIYPSSGGSGGLFFIGQIIQFAGINIPGDCFECKGQILPISGYVALYTVIGTTYGGDGITTFALPNLTGKSIIGN
jgi:microcystin-dependent protein